MCDVSDVQETSVNDSDPGNFTWTGCTHGGLIKHAPHSPIELSADMHTNDLDKTKVEGRKKKCWLPRI